MLDDITRRLARFQRPGCAILRVPAGRPRGRRTSAGCCDCAITEGFERGSRCRRRSACAPRTRGPRRVAQMQIERRIDDVEPARHLEQALDRATVNLDATAIADEDHDRHGVAARGLESAAHAASVPATRGEFLSPASRSACTRPTLNLPSMPKNSCVSYHRSPCLTQPVEVDLESAGPRPRRDAARGEGPGSSAR